MPAHPKGPRVKRDATSRMPIEPIADVVRIHTPRIEHGYVELEGRTCFSFLQSAARPEALVERAATLGYDTLAITDRDGLYGVVRAVEAGRRCNVRIVVGCEITLDDALAPAAPQSTLIVLVQNHTGYQNLCRILTESHARHPKGKARLASEGVPKNCFAGIDLDFVCAHAEGLFALVAADEIGEQDDHATLRKLRSAFGERLSLRVFRHLDGRDAMRLRCAMEAHNALGIDVCVTNALRFSDPQDKDLHDVLHCIREGITLEQAGRALAANAEAHLKSPQQMSALFAQHPEWITRSRRIAAQCTFAITDLKYQFPSELENASEKETPIQALHRLTYEGAALRFPEGMPPSVATQVEHELALIKKRDVAPFFLSVKHVVDLARGLDILCQGRGSAANSAVCYCLGITAVDPTRSNLLFERFLSAERDEPPDIDVDFEHERREEVIQAIYKHYGRDRAAMVSEVICYRSRSALREVGKVFGFSQEEVSRLGQIVTHWDGLSELSPSRITDAGFEITDVRVQHTLSLAHRLRGIPRHLSIHVGGFVLSAAPLCEVAPVEPATMPGRTIIPWDKDDLDTLGFFKMDVLGLGMLTAIRKALAYVQHDERVNAELAVERLRRIPSEDSRVYDALCQADSIGVFQVESRAQMSMLPRLRPRKFYDLVVQVAIVRPGPIQGGMVHPYLRRRAGKELAVSPHPILEPILNRTLGVPLFQEQVMQIAITGAGYSGGDADQLRRDMAAWKKTGNLERHRQRLIAGFQERGISMEFAERLYSQMQGFGEYGFPESHASSFALLVYASSWLKTHHPAAFAAALINSQPMGFYSPSAIIQDAQRHGVQVLPICVNNSDWDCTLEGPSHAPALRLGLRLIRGLGEPLGTRIMQERRAEAFLHMDDFCARVQLPKAKLTVLAKAGALQSLEQERRQALWSASAPRIGGLFKHMNLDTQRVQLAPMTRSDQLTFDYAITGLSVGDHPMKLARNTLPAHVIGSQEIAARTSGQTVWTAGLVTCRQRPQTANSIVFVTIEDEHGQLNLILYSDVFQRFHHVATTSALIVVQGRLEREEGVTHILVHHIEPLRVPGFNVDGMSRDFH